MTSISLCMIVKNETHVLARCLNSIADLVDEIIIVDTGSTDDTKKIASQFTDQIYDFSWNGDFSSARNFAFSLATKDYIYSADADEMLDEINRTRFLQLKQAMLPEIEIVQMKYITTTDFNTVLNAKKEYRPKLFKRIRSFTWIDPVHETIRLDPVVFDSDIEILHMPLSMHHKRDFHIFLDFYHKNHFLSDNIRTMYAKELMICGEKEDFLTAKEIFYDYLSSPEANRPSNASYAKEATCILLKTARLTKDFPFLLQYSLNDMLTTPSSEACTEIGLFFMEEHLYETAILWFYNAAFETESYLNIHTGGDLPLSYMSQCYKALANSTLNQLTANSSDLSEKELHQLKKQHLEFKAMATEYEKKAIEFELPEEL